MADGTVKIDITADASKATKSVEQLNKSIDGAFQDKSGRWRAANGRFLTMKEQSDMLGKSLDDMGNKGGSASLGIGKIVTALGLVKLASGAIDLLKSSLDGAIERYDTMNNFPRIMEQLGFSTDESTAAIDKLSDGVSGLPTPLNEIVKSAQGIALMTGDLDGATDTALALNNAFLASGSSAGDTSRGMQQYVQMLSRGEVDLMSWRTLQETMGVALNETAKAFGFAGKSAQNDLYSALQDGSITFEEFNAKIVELDGGVNGFSERAKTASAGIGTAFANMRTAVVRGMEGVIRSIDDALAANGLPSIQQMIEAVGTAFETVLSGMAAKIPGMIAGFVSFYNAIQPFVPAIIAIGAAFLTYQTIMSVVGGVTKLVSIATGILNAVMTANPIALVIAAIVGLVAAFIYLWNTNEGFKEFFINVWNIIKETAVSVWEAIQTAWSAAGTWFTTMWASIKQGAVDMYNAVKQYFIDLWSSIKEGAISLWDGISATWNSFVESIKLMWEGIKTFFINLWTTIKDLAVTGWNNFVNGIMMILSPFILGITNIFNALLPGIQLIWDGIKMAATAAWELIKIAVMTPILVLVDLITGDFEGMKSHLTQIWDNIKMYAGQIWQGMATAVMGIVTAWIGFLTLMWNGLKNITSAVFNAIKTGAINAWNATKNGVINAANALKQGAIDAWNNLKTGVINAGNALKQGAINAWNALKSGVINAANAVKSGAINAWNNMKSSVINVANNLKQGAINAWNSLKSSTSNIFNDVVSSIKSILNIDLYQIGKNIIQGLVNGIGSMVKAVANKIQEVASGIKDKITGALGIHSPSRWMRDMVGKNIPRGIAVGIEADTKTATKAMNNMASQLMMPKLTAESAMGIGNRMSTSPSSLMNTTKNTTVTNDNSMAVHIGNVENNSDSDIPKILEEAAWIMSRDKRRLGYE